MQVQRERGKQIKGLTLPVSEPGVCFHNLGRRQRSRTGVTAVPLGVGKEVNSAGWTGPCVLCTASNSCTMEQMLFDNLGS